MGKGLLYRGAGGGKVILPKNFIQVEFIESIAASSCIDLGISFNPQVDAVEVDYQRVTASDGMIVSTGSAVKYFWLYDYSGTNAVSTYIVNTSGNQVHLGNYCGRDNTRKTFKYDARQMYLNGTLKVTSTQNFATCADNLCIMSWINQIGSYSAYGKYFNVKVWTNGILTRNLYPCCNISSTIAYKGTTSINLTNRTYGLYDVIEEKFYINSGTAEFRGGMPIVLEL